MRCTLLAAALVLVLGGYALANMILVPPPGGVVAPSCNAIITGSGANGNAILTGSATALGNMTCQ